MATVKSISVQFGNNGHTGTPTSSEKEAVTEGIKEAVRVAALRYDDAETIEDKALEYARSAPMRYGFATDSDADDVKRVLAECYVSVTLE